MGPLVKPNTTNSDLYAGVMISSKKRKKLTKIEQKHEWKVRFMFVM